MISSGSADEHYVGLALDLNDRFHNATYGHLAPKNKSRAARLIASGSYYVQVPHIALDEGGVHGRVQLSRLEIETYVRLVASGGYLINSLAMLGRVGETPGNPVIVCDCASGTYVFADSVAAASRLARSRGLFAVVHGYQRTAGGYAARWATAAERASLADRVGPSGLLTGALVKSLVTRYPRNVVWAGTGRSGRFQWITGPLTSADLDRLARYRRTRYMRHAPTGYRAVSWSARNNHWRCRARTGPDPKKIWQIGRRGWTPLDAAIAREKKIRAEGWEHFNSGLCGSNADAINAALGAAPFRPW